MKNMTPEQMKASMAQAQSQMGAQKQYMYNAAEMLKTEGNVEVKKEAYPAALAKYGKASRLHACARAQMGGVRPRLRACGVVLRALALVLVRGGEGLASCVCSGLVSDWGWEFPRSCMVRMCLCADVCVCVNV